MHKKRLQIRPIVTILATLLILGSAIYAVLMTIAREGDAHQQDMEHRVIESALNQQRMNLSNTLVQQAYWDNAYDAVGPHLDLKWLDRNLGQSAQTAGVPISLVLNRDAQVIYRFSASGTANDAALLEASPSMEALAERALSVPVLPPTPVTAFVRVRDQIYLAAMERIVPNDARAARPLARSYVLANLVPFDAARLRTLQSGFGIAPLSLAARPNPGLGDVVLFDANAVPLGHLGWSPARPGREFANAAAPMALSCFALLATLQLVVLRSWLQAAQRMRDEGVAKTMFLANASHELRTPLNAIIGFSECMVAEMFGPIDARYREYARDIRTSGQLLLGIVNDVLDLTHLNSTADIVLEPVKLSEALTGAMRMLREYAKGDRITIDYVDNSDGVEVAANEKALCQILLNLGSNAVKFSPPHTTVDIALQRGADFVDLVVRDRGAGISAEKLRFIGQPFFQAHETSTRKPGSGLGLAIVKKLTQRLGGEFTIASAPGAGTTVTVRLRQHRPAPEPLRARAA
ncbi:MAG TPA: ATP-binding protein [Rhizomicrobium sp.]|jgi:cell cycle sensor histidine kinase DivJ